MELRERIEAFAELGGILRDSLDGRETGYTADLLMLINKQQYNNPWFTPENVRMAIKSVANELTYDNLTRWTGSYPDLGSVNSPKNVCIVMAGNIPLVGFHDFLSVLITGNNIISKTSSKDPELIIFFSKILININPGFSDKISFTSDFVKGFDTVIATGGDNSSRYFGYYFGRYPNIIRKNRNSIAILEGHETDDELAALGTDIFSYFGLGCRNVSKVYIPDGYDFADLISGWNKFSSIIYHNKYANNYDFNKAVCLVNKEPFLDPGFILLRENESLSSPVAMLHYEFYNSLDDVSQKNEMMKEKIQCIVGRHYIPFGNAQSPRLWDYADGIDTVGFLLKKNMAGIL